MTSAMPLPTPHWVNPGFRLIECDRELGWAEIAGLAADLVPKLPAHGRVAIDGRSVAMVLAALTAAERAGIELVLLREGFHRASGASERIGADGRLTRVSPAVDTVNAFAVLMPTSGTLGNPKLVRHDFIRLIGRIRGDAGGDIRWLLTYEPTGFGGLQVVLSAVAAGATLIVDPRAGIPALADAAVAHGASHVSATPSFWRAFLIALGQRMPPVRMITLGGEVADQALLDQLNQRFPEARIGHLYATTEAGALFLVRDGASGFPASWLTDGVEGVRLRIGRDGRFEVKSPRAMIDYATGEAVPLTDDGWLVTGDLVERDGDRVRFVGRSDGVINVGGVKVAPERVEQVLLAVPGVADARVSAAANPITGQLLTAAVVAAPGVDPEGLRASLHHHAQTLLAPAERPRLFDFVPQIPIASTGKKRRAPAGAAGPGV